MALINLSSLIRHVDDSIISIQIRNGHFEIIPSEHSSLESILTRKRVIIPQKVTEVGGLTLTHHESMKRNSPRQSILNLLRIRFSRIISIDH